MTYKMRFQYDAHGKLSIRRTASHQHMQDRVMTTFVCMPCARVLLCQCACVCVCAWMCIKRLVLHILHTDALCCMQLLLPCSLWGRYGEYCHEATNIFGHDCV